MDLIWRCLVSVRAMMSGPVWLVSIFFRSRMVVCIPRVLRVRALVLWCVYLRFVGCKACGGVVCVLLRFGCLRVWEWVGVGVLWGVGLREVESASAIWGLGMGVSVVGLRPCVIGDGFHALH